MSSAASDRTACSFWFRSWVQNALLIVVGLLLVFQLRD